MKTCLNCHKDFTPAFRVPQQKFCSRFCCDQYYSRHNRPGDEYNDRSTRRTHHKFYIYVRQPGQAEFDGWHKNDYERYKHELPKGTELMRP